MAERQVTVFGGSGFIGRHLIRRLAARGDIVRVAVRDPEAAAFLKPMGDVGQITPLTADLSRPETIAPAVEGADAVVNLVGILYERGRQRFQSLHADGAGHVARAAAAAGARDLVHISALGADADALSAYARAKAAGEVAVRAAFPDAVIQRPSVVFGPEDDFFNGLAWLARLWWVLPVLGAMPSLDLSGPVPRLDLLGTGGPRFQPVFAGDVAEAIVAALIDPACRGRVFELAGPRVFTFAEVLELVCKYTGRRRLLLPVPLWVARFHAIYLQYMPKPFLTPDQVRLLATDNVAGPGAPGLADLGISPMDVEAVLPTYLARYRGAAARRGERLARS
ncbi:MAG: complex I NDUFA9 subunit family protein [Alphaproteobacteria bacterium]